MFFACGCYFVIAEYIGPHTRPGPEPARPRGHGDRDLLRVNKLLQQIRSHSGWQSHHGDVGISRHSSWTNLNLTRRVEIHLSSFRPLAHMRTNLHAHTQARARVRTLARARVRAHTHTQKFRFMSRFCAHPPTQPATVTHRLHHWAMAHGRLRHYHPLADLGAPGAATPLPHCAVRTHPFLIHPSSHARIPATPGRETGRRGCQGLP